MNKHLTEQRMAEINEALVHTEWRRFDREDVAMLVREIERLRTELRTQGGGEQPRRSQA